jgi:hypothetical protein
MAHVAKLGADLNQPFIQKGGQSIKVVLLHKIRGYRIVWIELKKGRNNMSSVKRDKVWIVRHFPVVLNARPIENTQCEYD